MKCKKVRKFISKYFDGVLPQEEKEIVLLHIKECYSCKLEFDILSKIYTNLPEYKDVEPSSGIRQKILLKIEEQQDKKVVLFKKLVPAVASVSIFVILLIAIITPCKSVNFYKENYVFYPQEDIDLTELELTNFLNNLN